jgi:signal transduction histidine kinase
MTDMRLPETAGGADIGSASAGTQRDALAGWTAERAAMYEAERRARTRAERLQELTAALSVASTQGEIAQAVVQQVASVFGGVGTVIAQVAADGTELELVRAVGMPDDAGTQWARFPVSAPVPLAEVVRTGEPIFLESREAWARRYPDLLPLLDSAGHAANVVVPLVAAGRPVGALGVAFNAPRPFDEGERAFVVAVARQCALALERARLYDAERKARAEAEASSRAKSEFLAVMSHELRTPLNAIGGYAQILEMGVHGPVTEAQREALRRIQRSQRHLLGLITQVMAFARVEAGTLSYDIRTVAVADVIATVETLVAPQMLARDLTYELAGGEQGLAVRADPEKLRQVLVNLLSNAVKFTAPGGRIVLECEGRERDVALRVRDTGCGIPPGKLDAVFEPFVQLGAGPARPEGGVGLGLAISRSFARRMGGELTAESVVDAGSTFTLILPRADGDHVGAAAVPTHQGDAVARLRAGG